MHPVSFAKDGARLLLSLFLHHSHHNTTNSFPVVLPRLFALGSEGLRYYEDTHQDAEAILVYPDSPPDIFLTVNLHNRQLLRE
jgi:hypothetical protein